ncbi:MAG: TAXI family TRAP transporter solute-binding subunit [Burkholderiaceae bacterium]
MKKLTILAAAAALAAGLAAPAQAQQVRFMTGPQGGSWIPLGGALKAMWEGAIPGLQIQMTPGAGIANVRGIDENKSQVGFANSITTVDGLKGNPPYPKAATNVCQLANLYPQYFQVVALADSGVNEFADFKGKAMVMQPKGNTAEIITLHMLKVNGLDYGSLSKANFVAGYNDAVSMLKDGHAAGFTLGTTAPASAVMNLASARDIRLIGVDDKTLAEMKKINPGYHKLPIKAGTYPKQDKDVEVIAYSTHLVVACDLPDDMVYGMAKAIAGHIGELSGIVKSIETLTPKGMAVDIGVPLHKGAEKFYKEVGAL